MCSNAGGGGGGVLYYFSLGVLYKERVKNSKVGTMRRGGGRCKVAAQKILSNDILSMEVMRGRAN